MAFQLDLKDLTGLAREVHGPRHAEKEEACQIPWRLLRLPMPGWPAKTAAADPSKTRTGLYAYSYLYLHLYLWHLHHRAPFRRLPAWRALFQRLPQRDQSWHKGYVMYVCNTEAPHTFHVSTPGAYSSDLHLMANGPDILHCERLAFGMAPGFTYCMYVYTHVMWVYIYMIMMYFTDIRPHERSSILLT